MIWDFNLFMFNFILSLRLYFNPLSFAMSPIASALGMLD